MQTITRKIPPKVDTTVPEKIKNERNYTNLRKNFSLCENAYLKKLMSQQLETEEQELQMLAERVGYLDPLKKKNFVSISNLQSPRGTTCQGLQDGRDCTQGADWLAHETFCQRVHDRALSQPRNA